jgi:two-component sensor histidine kinase
VAWRAWLPQHAPRPGRSILLGVALSGAATALRWGIESPLNGALPFITYFPALIIAAAIGGYAGGLASLAVATLAVAVLLMPVDRTSVWAYVSFIVAGGLVVAVGAALADSVRQLRLSQAKLDETQGQLKTLVDELAHRNRNALFVIMSIVSQSARAAASAAEAERIINARLEALVRAQDVVLHADGASASLRPLFELAVEPFDLSRFEIAAAPEFRVEADVAVGLGLLFHELATNAVKYGALATPDGRVQVTWTLEAEAARFTWKEIGGPKVEPPARRGFGGRLLEVALVPQGGKAERRFESDGLVCELLIPPPAQSPGRKGPAAGAAFARAAAPRQDDVGGTRSTEPTLPRMMADRR